MEEEYWIKCGFKENGELICTRLLANSRPSETFFYKDGSEHKEVRDPHIVKITRENLRRIGEV
ncbi:hypothetical protein KY345_06575 [Candidatus Woesearchaeota archaeon]|nr:hypothetical protein [Candidatus Woesearchaeota archaeon]